MIPAYLHFYHVNERFFSIHRTGPDHIVYQLVNLSVLEENFEANDVVDTEALRAKGLFGKKELMLKVLANGEITKPLTVKAEKFSAAAQAKIEAAGGKCEVIG